MRSYAILDPTDKQGKPASRGGYYLKWELSRRGLIPVPIADADVILSTMQCWALAPTWRRLLRQRKRGSLVVLGGGAAHYPAAWERDADLICVGEGPRFIDTLITCGREAASALPNCWIAGELRQVVADSEYPWAMPPICMQGWNHELLLSRGCKRMCLFCDEGWFGSYTPRPDLKRAALDHLRRGGGISWGSNDLLLDAPEVAWSQYGLSGSVAGMRSLLSSDVPYRRRLKKINLGVEGVSERLRRAIKKPVTNELLLNVTRRALALGIKVAWYFVIGFPQESNDDYSELRSQIANLRRIETGNVLLNFHAWIPMPSTPLAVLPMSDDYWGRWQSLHEWLWHGPGSFAPVRVNKPCSPSGRLKRALVTMAATESQLRAGWWEGDNPNWRVKYAATPAELRRRAREYLSKLMLASGFSRYERAVLEWEYP